MDARSDAELLKDSVAEPLAFGLFFDRHAEATLAHLYRLTRNREVAFDLTDEVFALALLNRSRYRKRKGSAREWLFAIAEKVLADSCRRHGISRDVRERLGMSVRPSGQEAWQEVERRLEATDWQRSKRAARGRRRWLPV